MSVSWSRFVGTTVEWQALVFVHLDSAGYLRYAARNGLVCLSSTERLRGELANYRFFFAECMEEIEARVGYTRLRELSLPFYTSFEECLLDADVCPEYYGL